MYTGTSDEPTNLSSFPVTTTEVSYPSTEVSYPSTEVGYPTTSVTGRAANTSSTRVFIAGIVTSVIVVIIIIATVTVSMAVWLKFTKVKQATVPIATNQAYGVTLQDMATHTEEGAYIYSVVDQANTIEAKQNEAYDYATNIVTERNEAAVITTVSESVDESSHVYDYIS